DLDGVEVTRQIRASSEIMNANIPIIALTASVLPRDRETCREAGMNDFLSKPLKRDELLRVISQWLEKKKPAPAAAAPPSAATPAAASDATDAMFDRAALLDDLGDDDFVTTLINGFVADLPGHLTAMSAALEANDLPALRERAHALKSSAANLRAAGLHEQANALELAAADGNREQAATSLAALKDLAARMA
ncbi:MAG: Hpt domain-containing protein, partial [Planctomycetota bacterium]